MRKRLVRKEEAERLKNMKKYVEELDRVHTLKVIDDAMYEEELKRLSLELCELERIWLPNEQQEVRVNV